MRLGQVNRAAVHALAAFSAVLLCSGLAPAAEFLSGQAARAVIGQSSFSAREPGIAVSTLAVFAGRLYVTDVRNRVASLDLTKIPGPADDLESELGPKACALCGFLPAIAPEEKFVHGSAAVSTYGNTVAVADAQNHRVVIWRDLTANSSYDKPDIILGQASSETPSISGITLRQPISVLFDGKHLFVGDAALHRVLVWNSLPKSDAQPADEVLGQANFSSVHLSGIPDAESISRPAALASDGMNLFVGDSDFRRILVFTPGDLKLRDDAIKNSASLAVGPLAPGTLVSITGDALSDGIGSAEDDGVQHLPLRLAGVEVIFDGIALPLLSVSPTQVRAQLPYDLDGASSGSLYVRTDHNDGTVTVTNAIAAKIVPANPGLFAFGGPEPRSGLVVHADGDRGGGGEGVPVTTENAAEPGETVTLWATGLGQVKPNSTAERPVAGVPFTTSPGGVEIPITALVAGRSARVASAILPAGAIGVYEIHVVLPPDLPSNVRTELAIIQNGYVSNTIIFPVESAAP